MGKSKKLFKALVSGVKAFKSPSKEKAEKDSPSNKADKDHLKRGGKEKCLWSLGKSSSRNRDSLSAAAAFLDAPEIKSVQIENLHVKDMLPTSGSCVPDSGNGSKGLNIQAESFTGHHPLNHMKDFKLEELAAVRIQAAIRSFLVTKQVVRALRALVRLQALCRGRIVRKQAAASLRCIQALVKVQALARGRHVRSSELGQLIQRHIQQSRQQKKKPVEGWVSSMGSVQQLQAKAQSKQDAVMKRQRALVYAFSEQLNRCASKQTSPSSLDYQPDKSYWGWVWLERWMAAQPVGISHNMAKEQQNKSGTEKGKPDADLYAEAYEMDLSPLKGLVENKNFISITGGRDGGVVPDDIVNSAAGESVTAEEKETAVVGKNVEHMKNNEENFVSAMSTSNVVKRPLPSPPPPPPPPPPVTAKLVPKPSLSSFFQSSPLNVPLPPAQGCTKVVQRALPLTPPPPPPPPPLTKRAKPFIASESSSSECQQTASSILMCSQTSKFSHSTLSAPAPQLPGGEILSAIATLPFSSAAPAVPDVLSSPSVTSTTSISLPNESLPAPSIPEIYHDPLHTTSTAPSITSRNSGVMHDQLEKATVSTLMADAPSRALSFSHSSMSPNLLPEVLASSPQRYATLCTPLIIPNVSDEDMSDSAEETRMMAIAGDLTSGGEPGVNKVDVVTTAEEGVCLDSTAGNADQGEIYMDLEEPDVLNVLKIDEATEPNHPSEENVKDITSGTVNDVKAMEVSPIKQIASPPSRQGHPAEAVTPSLPNYMTTTKSSKAKIRSPTQKLDSPKQKLDPSKPRFDASKSKSSSPKQKLDSPKQRRDHSKQKADSPSQKADSTVKRRHSLSTLEGRGSPGANKLERHVRASSKSQLVSLRGGTSMDDSPRSNGHSCRVEK